MFRLIKTEELNALVQKGAEAGKYVMIDSRPSGRYHQAHIPTSVSLPFDAMDKLDKEGRFLRCCLPIRIRCWCFIAAA
ncbi:MAG: rhodanese-like domain-containing protein [Desulfuromonadaceae bacterium]